MPPPPRPPPSTKPLKPKTPAPPAPAARAPSVIEVDVKNFVALLNSPVPVILDCYATWCDPCKKLTPVLERIVGKYPGRIILGKLDVDKHPEMAAQLNVSSLPAVFGLCEGKLVDRFVGMPTEPILAGFLDKMLSIIPPAGAEEGAGGAPSVAERQEADLALADDLMKGENDGGKDEKDKATEAGALYKIVYEELAAEETPAPYLQARCLAGLARCALMGGAAEEAKQIVQMLRTKHKAEMESMPVSERERRREGEREEKKCAIHSDTQMLTHSHTHQQEVAAAVSFVEVALQAPPEEGGASAVDTLQKLQQAVAMTPTDMEARHQLALKSFQLQRFEAAMNECLEVGVGEGRKGGREGERRRRVGVWFRERENAG